MGARARAPREDFFLPRARTCHICPRWGQAPQPPDPTSGPLHGLQGLKKTGSHRKHLLPVSMKACLAEEMPRKVQKIKPSLWGRQALPGPAKKPAATGPGFWDGSLLSALWRGMDVVVSVLA